jgi:Na+-transporting NADH:ubiquinone oxidoreductase subunit NqrB
MTVAAQRSIRVGERKIPVVLPNRRDARLHTAAVILTIHTIGVLFLGFEVSVPQILSAIGTAALIDAAFTYFKSGSLIWPASGMLTGSGVALILRYVDTGPGQYWSWAGWQWFAAIAGVSVLTKYVIKWRGAHVFNPSNVGLVAAFLIVGSGVIEPLDFWWAPLGLWMLVAYVLIVGGGIVITRRLHLLETAVVFWTVLIAGLGVLAASGHCMIATWSTTPVCDMRFWATLSTSPEVLIFLFFMITDPKTIPTGRTARVVFAGSLAILATLLMAPQAVEYGAKVALLGSLVMWSPLRWAFDRIWASEAAEGSGTAQLITRLTPSGRPVLTFTKGLALGSLSVLVAIGIVVAGAPARDSAAASGTGPVSLPVDLDVAGLPVVTIDDSTDQLDISIDENVAGDLAVMLAENLALEAEAIRTADAELLSFADGGERVTEIQARIDDAITSGKRVADHYQLESLLLRLADESEGQASAALAFDAEGIVSTVTYDANGREVNSSSRSFATTFVLRQLAGDRWLIVTEVGG